MKDDNQVNDKIKVIFVHLPPEDIMNLSEQTEIIERLIRCISKPYLEVVGGLIFDKNHRILSCRRPKEKSWSSWWEFPGGKVEKKVHKEEYAHEEFGQVELKEIPRVKRLSGPQLVRSWT